MVMRSCGATRLSVESVRHDPRGTTPHYRDAFWKGGTSCSPSSSNQLCGFSLFVPDLLDGCSKRSRKRWPIVGTRRSLHAAGLIESAILERPGLRRGFLAVVGKDKQPLTLRMPQHCRREDMHVRDSDGPYGTRRISEHPAESSASRPTRQTSLQRTRPVGILRNDAQRHERTLLAAGAASVTVLRVRRAAMAAQPECGSLRGLIVILVSANQTIDEDRTLATIGELLIRHSRPPPATASPPSGDVLINRKSARRAHGRRGDVNVAGGRARPRRSAGSEGCRGRGRSAGLRTTRYARRENPNAISRGKKGLRATEARAGGDKRGANQRSRITHTADAACR